MIRNAVYSDLDEILAFAQEYYARMEYEAQSGIPFDVKTVRALSVACVRQSDKILIVNTENNEISGICAGALFPWVANQNQRCAQEFICWGKRTEDMRAYFDVWAQQNGAKTSIISCFVPQNGTRFRRLD